MSKFDPLWRYISDSGAERILMTCEDIGKICGVPIDHSFLTCKKELPAYGYRVGKILMKTQTVEFIRVRNEGNEAT